MMSGFKALIVTAALGCSGSAYADDLIGSEFSLLARHGSRRSVDLHSAGVTRSLACHWASKRDPVVERPDGY